MNLKLFSILILFILCSTLSAQISLGLNLEPFALSGDINSEGISPLGISASIGYQFDSTKYISLRAGFYSRNFDARQFAGTNYSLLGKYQFNNSLYVLTGLTLYNNDATSSMSGKITNRLVALIGLGLGAKPLSWLHIENIFFIPVANREFASVYYMGGFTQSYKISYLFKFSLGVEFEL